MISIESVFLMSADSEAVTLVRAFFLSCLVVFLSEMACTFCF